MGKEPEKAETVASNDQREQEEESAGAFASYLVFTLTFS
jgi:hypothetical protein